MEDLYCNQGLKFEILLTKSQISDLKFKPLKNKIISVWYNLFLVEDVCCHQLLSCFRKLLYLKVL